MLVAEFSHGESGSVFLSGHSARVQCQFSAREHSISTVLARAVLSHQSRVQPPITMTVGSSENKSGASDMSGPEVCDNVEPIAMQKLRSTWLGKESPIADFLAYLTEYQGTYTTYWISVYFV